MIKVGKWAVGMDRNTGDTIIRFEFLDRAPLEFLVPKEQATEIARAMLDQSSGAPGVN